MELSNYFGKLNAEFDPTLLSDLLSLLQTTNKQASKPKESPKKRLPPKTPLEPQPVPKKITYTRLNREEELAKRTELEEFTKKLYKEQREREERRKEQLQKYHEALKVEEEQKRAELEAEAVRREELRQNRLKKLQETVNKRREQTQSMRVFAAASPPTQVPLFKKMERHFTQTVELPELQKRKEILASKRKMVSPVSLKDLFEHQKRYELNKLQFKTKNNQSFRRSESTANYAELLRREREVKLAHFREQSQRKQLAKWRKEQAELMQAAHWPKIDPLKRQEMYKLRLELEHPVEFKLPKYPLPDYLSQSKALTVKHSHKDEAFPKTIKPKKDPYLDKRRLIQKAKHKELLTTPADLPLVNSLEACQTLEKKAARHEAVLKHPVTGENINLKEIEALNQVNEMMLASVKTKLNYLQTGEDK